MQKKFLHIEKSFVCKRATYVGDSRKILQLGIIVGISGNRLKIAMIKRRLVQTRIS